MGSLEERQQFVQDVLAALDEQREEEEEEQLATMPPNNDQSENQQDNGMPKDLSTPVNLMKKPPTEKSKKKKKKKKKAKTVNLPEAGAPIADDYEEKYNEDEIENPYHPSRSLSQRVEYAIMKYRKNHRFTESKRGIFDQYLRFGGITTGPNAFLGRATSADAPDDPEVEQDWDAAKTAIDTVPEEQDEDLYVSFSEVAQVYLGNAFIRQSFFVAPQDFVDAPQLVDAFLRYLEIRNVCPEYKEDIAKAREIAAQAKVELPMCKHAARLLPGAFNEACSQLFGAKAAAVVLDSSWANMNMKARDMLDDFLGDVNVSTAKATRLVSPVIKEPKKRKVVEQREDILVKIVDISPFASDARDDQLVPVTLANFEDESEKFEILLEKHILASLLKGMVLLPTLHKLDSGQWYMDNNTKVYPTFYMVDECADPDQLFFE